MCNFKLRGKWKKKKVRKKKKGSFDVLYNLEFQLKLINKNTKV